MKLEIILQVISLLISGFIGYMIKDFLSKKSEKETRLFERKEKRYKEIFGLLINLYREKEESKLKIIKESLMKEYDFAWLYASDKVIRAINNFFDSISPDTNINSNTSMSLLFTIIIEMRKDLSIKSKLNVSDWKPRNPYK